MSRLRLEKEQTIEGSAVKDIRSLFGFKNEIDDNIITSTRSLQKIIRDIRNRFELENQKNNKSIRVGNFWSSNYIEYESNDDRKKLSIEEYLNKIKGNWNDIINDLKKSDTCKIQLAIAIS